ncbi:MAG: glycosyltransferase family 2 protein [Chloroflexota bacterium]
MSVAEQSPAAGRPSVSIIIVNYESTELLRRCLASVAASSVFGQTQTIVVDNASAGFDVEAMAAASPWVTWLPQAENRTFTGGCNIGYERAIGDFVLLLNPDTQLEPDALANALARFNGQQPPAAQGAYLLNDDGSLQRYYRRLPGALDIPVVLLGALVAWTARGRRYLMADERFDGVTPVDQPPGAFLMAPRALLGTELLEPEYFNYMSDVDLCRRLRRHGPIVVADDVRVHHARGGAGVGTDDPAAQLRLRHDLTWGVRHYFREAACPARAYLEAWLRVFWILRLLQVALRRPGWFGRAIRVARRALRGEAPAY